MITIPINKEYREFVANYAPNLVLGDGIKGGYSNLDKKDLNKTSRESFQLTGLFGELAWYIYRYNDISKFKEILAQKQIICKAQNKGDNGFDDSITHNNKTRFLDIKSSHIQTKDKIKYLNLVIPEREYHNNMIYVCAFTIGKDRKNVDDVVLAGWEINECISKRWNYDPKKFAVPTSELRPMEELEKFIK